MTDAVRPARASRTVLADLMSPPDANVRGTVFGGKILALVDKAAAVCAMRHAGKPCVTVAMERVEFLVPIQVGNLVSVEACLTYAGRTSVEVAVEVFAEDLAKGTRAHANSCLVTMVAVDETGRPSAIPGLLLESREEEERHAAAAARARARKAR